MMASGITRRNRLGRYLANLIALHDLTESVFDAVWGIAPDQDDVESRFAYAVQLALAELPDGFVTPEEFRSCLAQLLKDLMTGGQLVLSRPEPATMAWLSV
jgi:hypothetical protein